MGHAISLSHRRLSQVLTVTHVGATWWSPSCMATTPCEVHTVFAWFRPGIACVVFFGTTMSHILLPANPLSQATVTEIRRTARTPACQPYLQL